MLTHNRLRKTKRVVCAQYTSDQLPDHGQLRAAFHLTESSEITGSTPMGPLSRKLAEAGKPALRGVSGFTDTPPALI